MSTYCIGIRDLDLICYGALGVPLSYLKNFDEIEFFLNKIMGKVTSNVRKEVKREMEKYTLSAGMLSKLWYINNKFQYPYMINTQNWRILVATLEKSRKEKEEKK